MPFPESPRVIFDKNPIVEVICQLRFPPILEISAREPVDFQNAIRGQYPLYERVQGMALPREVAEVVAKIPGAQIASDEVTHRFSIAEGHRTISLTREFVAVSETHYRRWEDFRDAIATARAALESIYHPPFYSRVGLRYKNVIRPATLGLQSKRWSQLIRPQLLGLLGASETEADVSQMQNLTVVHLGPLAPDSGALIRHGPVTEESGEQTYVIDVDLFTDSRKDGQHVDDLLARFNRIDGNFFRWALQGELLHALGPTPADD